MAVDELELTTTGIAVGGDAVGRADDGRVVFVHGALPDERVRAEVYDRRKRFARARVRQVVEASPLRRDPPCPHVAEGCGGCGWQHATPDGQLELRRAIVTDALTRLGHISDPEVRLGPALAPEGYRTTVRAAVVGGRAAFRRWRSHDAVVVDSCLVAHPLVADLIEEGRFGGANEVTLRAGARTGERLVLAQPTAARVRVPEGVTVIGADELRAGRNAWYHEEVAGRRWRISAPSFFQARPDGAEALVAEVRRQIETHLPAGWSSLVDLCSGVGLFAGTVGDGRRVVAVERDPSSVADARVNLADTGADVVRAPLALWTPTPADVVVADPARSGLGAEGVAAAAATGAAVIVLVACDPAALGRDAGLLEARGYRFRGATVIDLFPQTPHVETVAVFVA